MSSENNVQGSVGEWDNLASAVKAPTRGPRYAMLGIAALLLTISAFLAGMTGPFRSEG